MFRHSTRGDPLLKNIDEKKRRDGANNSCFLARGNTPVPRPARGFFGSVALFLFSIPSTLPTRALSSCWRYSTVARTHVAYIRHLVLTLYAAFSLRTSPYGATEQQLAAQHDWLTAALTDGGGPGPPPGAQKWGNPRQKSFSRLAGIADFLSMFYITTTTKTTARTSSPYFCAAGACDGNMVRLLKGYPRVTVGGGCLVNFLGGMRRWHGDDCQTAHWTPVYRKSGA